MIKELMIAVEKKVPYEKCEKCDRTAYQKAKEKCDNRKSQLEKKFKNMTTGYESILVPTGMVQYNNNPVYGYSFASFP